MTPRTLRIRNSASTVALTLAVSFASSIPAPAVAAGRSATTQSDLESVGREVVIAAPPFASANTDVVDPPRDPEGLARAVMADMSARRFDRVVARFDARMSAALNQEQLAQGWETINAMAGPFKSVLEGKVTEADGKQIVRLTCEFGESTVQATLSIDSQGHLAGFIFGAPASKTSWAPADYVRPTTFDERPVVVGSDPTKLTGTLTVPKGKGPFRSVVLIQGSGASDQDETIGPNKPFKDLAWGLASRGIAVLRYHKRTFQYPDSLKGQFTVEQESIEDAKAAVRLLARCREIDAKHIYVAGHSLGAALAPRIAKGDPLVAGIVIMAGNTRPMEELIVEQVKYQASLVGRPTPETEKAIADAEKSAANMRNPALTASQTVMVLGTRIPGSYILDLRAYDPARTAASLKIPVMVLQGQRDCQVRMADYEGWKRALAADSRATLHLYPNLHHLFIPVPAGDTTPLSTPADYREPGHVASEVVADIAEWIGSQSQSGRPQ